MSQTVKIHMTDGTVHEVPKSNLSNVQRLQGNKISFVEDEDAVPLISQPPILTSVSAKPESTVSGGSYEFEMLDAMERDDLIRIGIALSEDKGINQPTHNSGKPKLIKYILHNQ